jgi:hypothetical protein
MEFAIGFGSRLRIVRPMVNPIKAAMWQVRSWVLSSRYTDRWLSEITGVSERLFALIRQNPQWDPHASTLAALFEAMETDQQRIKRKKPETDHAQVESCHPSDLRVLSRSNLVRTAGQERRR